METTASSQFSPSQASSQSSQSASDYSSDSSSMSTPIKPRAANLSDHRTDSMKAALKLDLAGHTLQEIGILDFVTTVWGLDKDIAEKIRTAKFTVPEESANVYETVLSSGHYNERQLHKPFLEINDDLLKQTCALLKILPEKFDNIFWDGKGVAALRNLYTERKPDLLNAHRLAVSVVWELVNAAVEFKKGGSQKQGTPLETIQEDTDLHTPVSSKSKNKVKKSRKSAHYKPGGSHQASVSLQSEVLSSVASTSTICSATTTSSSKRSADEALGRDVPTGRTVKRARVAGITLDQLQLATYALECLGASSRHYTTGIFIDKYSVSLWCYNRTAIFRTEVFKWNKNVQFLALALFALTQCDMKHAGFDPNVYRFTPPQSDDPVSASATVPLKQPVEDTSNLCFRFPAAKDVPDWIFWIQKVLYTYRGIVGRGTFVATVRAAIVGETMRKGLFAFKQSWQYQVRAHEASIIAKLRERLPKYWGKHLPEVIFHTKFTAEHVGLPHTVLKQQIAELLAGDAQERDLHVLVSTLCHNLWQAKDVEEFKRVFLDCLECHYHAYHTGRILHRDISENNLMIFRGEESEDALGILNDFDMATERLPDEEEAQVSAAHHRTGTLPFMALELLDKCELEPVHLYRHDLESFFYILIWAATHYDFESQTKKKTPATMRDWLDPNTAAFVKRNITGGFHLDVVIAPLVLAPFKELWEKWVLPLQELFGQAHQARVWEVKKEGFDNNTINGRITFEKFMTAIGESPRGLDPKLQVLDE